MAHKLIITQSSQFSTKIIYALLIPLVVVTSAFKCPSNLQPTHRTNNGCYCSSIGTNEYQINCQKNNTPLFDVSIKSNDFVRIQCRGTDRWYDGFYGEKFKIGRVTKFTFDNCQLPGVVNSAKVIRNLGVTGVEYLKYERLIGKLSKDDFMVFPDVKMLVLNENDLGEVDIDLLRGIHLN